jgi:hypothetical protein
VTKAAGIFELFVESSPTRNVITRNKERREIECKVTENVLTEILCSSLRAAVRVIHPTYPPTSSKTKSRNELKDFTSCFQQSLSLLCTEFKLDIPIPHFVEQEEKPT